MRARTEHDPRLTREAARDGPTVIPGGVAERASGRADRALLTRRINHSEDTMGASSVAAVPPLADKRPLMTFRVLLIDDDARLFELLQSYLGPNGVHLTSAPDG